MAATNDSNSANVTGNGEDLRHLKGDLHLLLDFCGKQDSTSNPTLLYDGTWSVTIRMVVPQEWMPSLTSSNSNKSKGKKRKPSRKWSTPRLSRICSSKTSQPLFYQGVLLMSVDTPPQESPVSLACMIQNSQLGTRWRI